MGGGGRRRGVRRVGAAGFCGEMGASEIGFREELE